MEALHIETVEVMTELRRFLASLENAQRSPRNDPGLRTQLAELETWVEQLRERVNARFQGRAQELVSALENLAHSLRTAGPLDWERKESLKPAYKMIGQAYEGVLLSIKRHNALALCAQQLRTLRPTNYHRNLFHVLMSVLGVSLYQWVFDGRQETLLALGCIVGGYILIEIPRRFSPALNAFYVDHLFRHIARPRENHQVSAATWYALGLLLAVAVAQQPFAQAAALTLGFGDPAATLVGKRWGKRTIWRERTWAGTLAFVAVATLVCFLFLWLVSGFGIVSALGIAFTAGFVGSTVELFCTDRIDDNLAIPTLVALVLALAFNGF